MRTFRDRADRTWRVDLSFALWRQIKAETGCDLLDVAMPDGKAMSQLVQMDTLGVVLWLYVAEQAAEAGISRDDFWRALDGRAINEAGKAIVEDLEDFSQSPQVTALRVAMEEAVERQEAIRKEIARPDSDVRRILRGESSTPGDTPASSPASSDHTPTAGDSAISSGPPRDPDATPGTVQV